jgi:hypothetical protein
VTDKIVPPPELVEQWRAAASNVPATLSTDPGGRRDYIDFFVTRAAQWGADQELEACCDHIRNYQWGFVERPDGIKIHRAVDLKIARRRGSNPPPPGRKPEPEGLSDEEVESEFRA